MINLLREMRNKSSPVLIESNNEPERRHSQVESTQPDQGGSCFKRSKNWLLKNAGKLFKKIL